jgi:hypothetical protein
MPVLLSKKYFFRLSVLIIHKVAAACKIHTVQLSTLEATNIHYKKYYKFCFYILFLYCVVCFSSACWRATTFLLLNLFSLFFVATGSIVRHVFNCISLFCFNLQFSSHHPHNRMPSIMVAHT